MPISFNVDRNAALRVGCAVECIHVYSLIHDDLPCMDDDDVRRGKPTSTRRLTKQSAVLAGDALHALAFEIVADEATHPDPFVRAELTLELARACGPAGMAGGQMMDFAAEEQAVDLAAITRLQQLKTGALIAFCVEAGAIIGRVSSPKGAAHLRAYARDVGLAFQIADDFLMSKATQNSLARRCKRMRRRAKRPSCLCWVLNARGRKRRCSLIRRIAHLNCYSVQEADLLRAIARYTVERDR